MSRSEILTLLILVAGMLSLVFFLQSTPSAKIRYSAERGMQWLLSYKEDHKDPVFLWALEDINQKYCRLSRITDYIQYRFAAFSDSETAVAYGEKLLNNASSTLRITKFTGTDALLLPVLYCNGGYAPEDVEKQIFDSSRDSGYLLTHKYVALLYFGYSHCKARAGTPPLAEALNDAALHIAHEQALPFNDLFAERVAVLELGEFQKYVDTAWIRAIAANQMPDGGWGNPHTSALSTWALAQYVRQCPII